MNKTIDSFDGDYYFLSNFFPCEIEYDGLIYSSNEHAFQAAKTLDLNKRKRFSEWGDIFTAGNAKREGRKLELRHDWNIICDEVMYEICKKKFENPVLKNLLLETVDAELIEGNNWYDTYWGMIKDSDGKWQGQNKLGKILMKIRDEIRQ